MPNDTPLRLLVKSYANGLLERDQYLDIRKKLLKKLSSEGHINHKAFQSLMKSYQDQGQISTLSSYSVSDWIIIVLGLMAAVTLGLFLYN